MPRVVPSRDLRKIAVKCRHCTRLIWLDEKGIWQRVNHSRSDPSRSDDKCIKNRYFYGRTEEQRARRYRHEPPHGWILSGGKWIPPGPPKPKTPDPVPKPLPGKPLSKIVKHPLPESVVIPVLHPHISCRNCRETVAICWDGKYSEDQRAEEPGTARICGCSDQNIIWHEPFIATMSFCPNPGCRLPVGDCVHGRGIQYPATAIRSQYWFGRWLTQRSCEKCWLAEELGDENTHCKTCPCCNCPCNRNGNPPLRCGYPGKDILMASWLIEADIIVEALKPPGLPGSFGPEQPLFSNSPPGRFEQFGGQIRYVETTTTANPAIPLISTQDFMQIDWPNWPLDLRIPWDSETSPFRLIEEYDFR